MHQAEDIIEDGQTQPRSDDKRPWVTLSLERVRLREAEAITDSGIDGGIYS